MLSKLRPRINSILIIFARPFMGLHPNIISLIGFTFTFVYFYFMLIGRYEAALISLAGIALDSLDGTVARLTGRESKFGGVLDSVLDRISDAVIIAAFPAAGLISWELGYALVVASLMVSYLRSRSELAGEGSFKLNVGLIERSERMIFIVVMTAIVAFALEKTAWGLSLVQGGFLLMLVLSVVTIGQRLIVTKKLVETAPSW